MADKRKKAKRKRRKGRRITFRKIQVLKLKYKNGKSDTKRNRTYTRVPRKRRSERELGNDPEEIRAREPEADEAEKPDYERAGRNEKDGSRSRLFSLLACAAQPGNRTSLMPTLRRHTQSAAKVRYRARSAQACPSLPPRGVTGARLPMRKRKNFTPKSDSQT